MNEAKWYMIYIGDSKRIPSVSSIFSAQRIPFTFWIPTKNALRKFRGKNVVKPKALFPGYIFVKFVYETAGVDDMLASLGGFFLKRPGVIKPDPVSEEYIQEIKKMESSTEDTEIVANTYDLKVDDVVEITNGPFLGGQGPIKEIKKDKLCVELDIMNRPVVVELDPRQVSKVFGK